MRILILGGGNMGLTFATSFIQGHIATHEQLLILEKSNEKAEELRKLNVGTVYGEPGDYIKSADLIIVAVKPQDASDLFQRIKPFVDKNQVILSIMAGVPIEKISSWLGAPKVVRAMPNLPAQIGIGMTVFTSTSDVTRVELVTVQNLLNATGKTIYVENEDAIDASTAISGSGPAYVFFYIQTLIESAMNLGFSKAQAEMLAYQTFRGAIELYNKYDYSCNEWIAKVSSKGGTTEAAFRTFAEHAAADALKAGIRSAYDRAKELSK